MTFVEVALFELSYQFRRPVFWICFALFFLLTFGAVTTDGISIGGSIGQVNRNAPFVIMQIFLVMSALGVFVTTAFVADTVQRDRELGTEGLFFSTRISKRDYLLGRFLGAFAAALMIFVGVGCAILVGSFMPWLEADRVGPLTLMPYLSSMALLVVPNAFLQACLFFALATATRSLKWTYVGVVCFMVGYGMSTALLGDIDSESLASLLDPFGLNAFLTSTKYWTVADRNTLALPLGRDLLLNRALWTGIGLIAFVGTYLGFRFESGALGSGSRRRKSAPALAPIVDPAPTPPQTLALPHAERRYGFVVALRQLQHQAWIEIRAFVLSAPFMVIVFFGMFNIVGSSGRIDSLGFGGEVYPVTHVVLTVIDGAYLFLMIVLVTFFAGETAFRERTAKFDGVHDSLPVPGWVFWGAKLTALWVAIGVMLAAAMVTGIGIQMYRGYTQFELPLYGQWLFLKNGIPFLMIAVLALCAQVIANNRYLGYLVMLLYLISTSALLALNYQHNLYHFAGAPGVLYSDMNGFGHFAKPRVWFYLYWGFCTLGIMGVMHLFWIRGADSDARSRFEIARQRLTNPVALTISLAFVGFAVTGAYIYWNTNVLNDYVPSDVLWDGQAAYEKAFSQYLDLPQPRITAVKAEVDIWPEQRAVDIRGSYTLVNKTDQPIERLHLWLNPQVSRSEMTVAGTEIEVDDQSQGYTIRRFAVPLAPAAEIELAYSIRVENPGFKNHGSNVRVVENGTFFDSSHYFPHIGYQQANELQDPNERKERGLDPIIRAPKLEDEAARRDNALSSEADWVHFETTVSTAADQIAMAPGYLEEDWTTNGRRHFRYVMDAPILAYWAYVSARYDVAKDVWNDVPIEVYYHPGHEYNVERMIDAVKKSLAYFTTNFSPYQHRQVRILEFPGYRTFAQSFPNTIPYAESIGFIARLGDEPDPKEVDYVFYVTAHEIAHQWWAHQVIGGNVQGASMLAETLSQYSALMVMEEEYGEQHMRKFLEQEELDRYLRQRGGERIEELPMMRVENQQYIHYNKGSVVMYALKDAIGADALNTALRNFIAKTAFQEPPYTTTVELLDELRAVTPEDRHELIADLFEHITLFDNRVTEARAVPDGAGRFNVTIAIDSTKLRADGQGVETELPVNDWIDVAVFGARSDDTPPEGKLLAMQKVKVTPDTSEVTLLVDERPRKAGFDPFNKLVDRNPRDNLANVDIDGD